MPHPTNSSGLASRPDYDEAAALLEAVCDGCEPSFTRLYSLTNGRLLNVVLRVNHDRAHAEEVLQDVYINVWLRAAQFDGRKGRAMQWMAGIAHHGAVSSLRHRNARPQGGTRSTPIDDDPYAGLPSNAATALDVVAQARGASAVQSCLRSLPAAHRESLTLAYYEGLSHAEIAQQLGRPVGTVKAWVRRSLLAMRPALSAHR